MDICQIVSFRYFNFLLTFACMSGHSKWANIKRDKAVNDAKRGKIFSKISRLIMVAAKEGGGDTGSNPKLRLAVDKAKIARMPKENIKRAIERGTGKGGGQSEFVEVIYEGFGPEGEAFYLKGLTDNRNRTAAEIRSIFSKYGGNLGDLGSTAYIFKDPDNPTFTSTISDENLVKTLTNMLEELEDHDDIQDVYINFDFGN